MKIWGSPSAGNPVRVAIFLAEKGIHVPFEPVDLWQGAHRSPDFRAKNPSGLVPVLELDDGSCISETIAICRYFERLHPNPPLMGIDPLDEAIVEMWQRRIEFEFFEPIRAVFRHSMPFMAPLEPVQLADWAALNRPKAAAAMAIMDAQLRAQPFIAGPRFTVADITAILAFQVMDIAGIAIPEGCDAVARWRDALLARPGVVAVIGAS